MLPVGIRKTPKCRAALLLLIRDICTINPIIHCRFDKLLPLDGGILLHMELC